MKKIKDFFWNYEFLLARNFNRQLIFLIGGGCCLVVFLLLYPFVGSTTKEEGATLTSTDLIGMGAYLLILLLGLVLNYRSWSFEFLKTTSLGMLVSLGRTLALVIVELGLMFVVKFIAILWFNIPPMYFTGFSRMLDVIWFYPILQLLIFFYDYKMTKKYMHQ